MVRRRHRGNAEGLRFEDCEEVQSAKPKFILADEPTANLDSKSTAKLLDIMEQLNLKEGITFLFSTHDQRVIDRARRVVTLTDGKITEDKIIDA